MNDQHRCHCAQVLQYQDRNPVLGPGWFCAPAEDAGLRSVSGLYRASALCNDVLCDLTRGLSCQTESLKLN